MLMKVDQSCLLIVDVQERLAPAVSENQRVIERCGVLMRAAARLGVPTVVSEQYPKGIGHTVAPLRELASPESTLEKVHFSCGADPALRERLATLTRPQVIVAGMEAHVCVLQTVLDLAGQGYKVFVVADACSSRDPRNADAAFERMRRNGIEIVTTEMVVFEWLHRAATPEFKELMSLIK